MVVKKVLHTTQLGTEKAHPDPGGPLFLKLDESKFDYRLMRVCARLLKEIPHNTPGPTLKWSSKQCIKGAPMCMMETTVLKSQTTQHIINDDCKFTGSFVLYVQ